MLLVIKIWVHKYGHFAMLAAPNGSYNGCSLLDYIVPNVYIVPWGNHPVTAIGHWLPSYLMELYGSNQDYNAPYTTC